MSLLPALLLSFSCTLDTTGYYSPDGYDVDVPDGYDVDVDIDETDFDAPDFAEDEAGDFPSEDAADPPPDVPLEAHDLNSRTYANYPIIIELSVTGDSGGIVSCSLVDEPINGVVNVEGMRAAYTPNLNFSGEDTFTYRAREGTRFSNTATVTLNVVMESSCKNILDEGLSLGDAIYTIDVDGEGEAGPIRVYCDMTVDSGGWILVGRSHESASSSQFFGWTSEAGSVDNDDSPYSLDAEEEGIEFTEILVGSHTSGKTWGGDAYKADVPPDFIETYAATAYRPDEGTTTVLGSCAPSGGPTMLSHFGHTEDQYKFFFRDQPDDDYYGLWANGFNTNYNECDRGGNLNTLQGMIFVR